MGKRSGLVGAILVTLLTVLGYFQIKPETGQYNIFLTDTADVTLWDQYEIVRYNPQLNILTVRGSISPFLLTLQSDVVAVTPDIEVTIQDAPNDTHWNGLWGMRRITREGESYDLTMGTSNVVAVVIDTGVDPSHPDLANARCVRSYVGGPCADGHGHGTHVSGTIAAVINNGEGVAGVVSSALVEIWAYKALSDGGSGTASGVARAIVDAADECVTTQKRCVINMSLGENTGGQPEPAMDQAIDYAVGHGLVVVSAAGNSNLPYCMAPAISENSMCVGAIDRNLQKASFSDYGKGLEIVAPGVGILSTFPGGSYQSWGGTSMATPHVVGAALAILSVYPDWKPAQVRAKLNQSAAWEWANDPNNYYGNGVVDVVAALRGGAPAPPTPGPSSTTPPYPAPTRTPVPTWTLVPTRTPTPTWTLVPTRTPIPTRTPVPTQTASPTVPAPGFDYSDRLSNMPVIRMDRTEGGAYIGRDVTLEDSAPDNEYDDGLLVNEDGQWREIEGETIRSELVKIYGYFRGDDRPWSVGCMIHPDGKIEKLFEYDGKVWIYESVVFPRSGDYAIRLVVGSGEPTSCTEDGVRGEVSDYLFTVDRDETPTPEPSPTPTPEGFWIHCVEREGVWNCDVENPRGGLKHGN